MSFTTNRKEGRSVLRDWLWLLHGVATRMGRSAAHRICFRRSRLFVALLA